MATYRISSEAGAVMGEAGASCRTGVRTAATGVRDLPRLRFAAVRVQEGGDVMDWNDRQNDGEAWDRIMGQDVPGPDVTAEDVRQQAACWNACDDPCEPGQVEAAIRYLERIREDVEAEIAADEEDEG